MTLWTADFGVGQVRFNALWSTLRFLFPFISRRQAHPRQTYVPKLNGRVLFPQENVAHVTN